MDSYFSDTDRAHSWVHVRSERARWHRLERVSQRLILLIRQSADGYVRPGFLRLLELAFHRGFGPSDVAAAALGMASQFVVAMFGVSTERELFLGRAPEEAADKIGLLRELHSLHERGVLSESEFNMKKWEILAS